MIFLIAAIAFFASTIGAICGIGGGVIIKPVMDAFGVMDVSVINFLSGCTVLSMTCYSVIKAKRAGDSQIEFAIDTPLAIGGGPINLVVLSYFFSMPTKRAAQSSLYIILFSQATSTVASLATGGAAGVDMLMLVVMACCGILGGFAGRKVNSRIDDRAVDKLFIGLMVVIMGICVFNMIKYMGV